MLKSFAVDWKFRLGRSPDEKGDRGVPLRHIRLVVDGPTVPEASPDSSSGACIRRRMVVQGRPRAEYRGAFVENDALRTVTQFGLKRNLYNHVVRPKTGAPRHFGIF